MIKLWMFICSFLLVVVLVVRLLKDATNGNDTVYIHFFECTIIGILTDKNSVVL